MALDELRDRALQTFSRGSGPGFLRGIDHQRLVEARACDHRGLRIGTLLGTVEQRGRTHAHLQLERDLSRGDGLLIEGGFASEGELGGRVWTLSSPDGKDLEQAKAGSTVLVWFGPDRVVPSLVSGRSVWKTNDPSVEKHVLTENEQHAVRVAIDLHVTGSMGELPTFTAKTTHGIEISVQGDTPLQAARERPLTDEVLQEKLGQLGETPFVLRSLRNDLPPGVLLPLSSLKRARRAFCDALQKAMQHAPHATTDVPWERVLEQAALPQRTPAAPGLFVLCRSLSQAQAALEAGADGVYLDFLELTGTGEALRTLRASGAKFVGVAPPRIRKPGEEKIDRYLRSLAPDAVLVRGWGALHERATEQEKNSCVYIGDFSLNVTNRITASEVLQRGLDAFTPSFDLDAVQLLEFLSHGLGPWTELIVHHPMALFHMEHCVIAATLSKGKDHRDCGRPCEKHQLSLLDRAGMEHPIEADVGCRNTVFHAAPQSAASLVPKLLEMGVQRYRIELVREEPAMVHKLVALYRALLSGKTPAPEVWKDLRAEGHYGVVRGSLRVLTP